jgi:hypothetical protein
MLPSSARWKPGHALHQRALARAVLAEQRVHRAGLDAHGHAVHRGECAEALGQLVGVERECAAACRKAAYGTG